MTRKRKKGHCDEQVRATVDLKLYFIMASSLRQRLLTNGKKVLSFRLTPPAPTGTLQVSLVVPVFQVKTCEKPCLSVS